MHELFEKLMDQINLPLEIRQSQAFYGADIANVEVHTVSNLWHFYLSFPAILDVEDYKTLKGHLEEAFQNIARIKLTILPEDKSYTKKELNDYYHLVFQQDGCNVPSFSNIFEKYQFYIDQNDNKKYLITSDLANMSYFEDNYIPQMEAIYSDFGFSDIKIFTKVDHELSAQLAEDHRKQIEEATNQQVEQIQQQAINIANNKPAPKKEVKLKAGEVPTKLELGREIGPKEPVTQMVEINTEENRVIFEGYIFDVERKVTKNGKNLIIFKMTDYTSSFVVQRWERKDTDLLSFDLIKTGMWVKVRGNVVMNNFTRDLVLEAQDIVEVKHPARQDLMPEGEKRVEFHAHTNMSTMDAIEPAGALVERAAKWGHKAIAITDHAGVQGFPEAYNAGKRNGVKILYGVEANLVEDRVPITYNEDDSSLAESTYVVFDVETTGLSAVYNNLIQIAASKMHKGNVIDEFDEFIDPGHHLSDFTTQLTGITDDHVRGSKPLKQVLEEFQEFCKGSVLVAHNATFDVGFMNMNYQRNNLPEITQPVVDTLEFARNLYPEYKRHGLGPLTKRFGVALDHHHMANYDAEATGRLLFIFLRDAQEKYGVSKLSDLNIQVVDDNSYKKARVKHATIYAQTQAGLKNLFKLVSYSNVDYFEGVPRIPKSVLEAHREGLLIGSSCDEGELFDAVTTKSFDHALEVANFYDFIEVMPPALYRPLIAKEMIKDEIELQNILEQLIKIGETLGKPVLATGNVHYLDETDALYREIIVRSLGAGAMINRPIGRGEKAMPAPLPEAHFRTTSEMLDAFAFLGEAKAREIVIDNTQKLADTFEDITPVREDLYTPYIEGTEEEVARLTYEKAHEIYGNPLPDLVDLRIEKELNSIIGNGFAVIYLISQKLVLRSNERGYLVGSRGSVGSSFVATMIGITEVNPLAPHYVCPNCQYSKFYDDGTYGSGYDMPEEECPECGTRLNKDGQDIPFETFLGFYGDKVPDIDLNFSGEDQPNAHLDVRDIFGKDYAFRAGTIGTVADKTAYGFVKGYERDYGKYYRAAEVDRLSKGSTGVKRTTGQHPGGIIVIPNYMDVYDFSPVQFPADDLNAEWQTTHFDFHAIHDNILKLDILGHDDPTMIRMLQDLSGIDPKDIPADDPEVMKIFSGPEVLGVTPEQIFSKTGTFGVPEFGTAFVRGMLEETKPKTFAELLQISGLSHGTDVWLGNAQELIKSNVANLSEVIGCRDDIMVYLIHAGLEEGMAFNIMERVRKGAWNKMDEAERDKYLAAMRENNVPEWYIDSCSKIKYMFPKAHAAAYVLMALRVAYFKVHYPIYYYCAYFSIRAKAFDLKTMGAGLETVKAKMDEIRAKDRIYEATKVEKDLYGTLELCNEMLERGLKFGQLDLYRSDAVNFIIEGDTLIPPFRAMDGLGESVAYGIVEARKEGEFLSKTELRKRAGVSQTLVEKMDDMGILGNMPEDNQLSLFDDMF
ncbi:PolC-type DNA polymerase III [Floricoccus tropicus]|uniref:DNA polymerase III PolC-type n=1 Tax=Floricoccus tropicus TaxID=1859473 RepID=A0A1E8GKB0_9LACT|nr:PolC-type DNA polymerase III [Floricoccus tropicus]OFI48617.1 PolC-type DNA polymerase III [Floricoccus tropicus]